MKIIVTGGNSGVGRGTASAKSAAGQPVVIACRSLKKGREKASETSGDVEVRGLDLADLTSVGRFADTVDSVDVLVNNTGVPGLPMTRTTAYASDPGMTHTGITRHGSGALQWADRVVARRIAQCPADGVRPTVEAVTTSLPNGTYLAPWRNAPVGPAQANDVEALGLDVTSARRLWESSTELTGCECQGDVR